MLKKIIKNPKLHNQGAKLFHFQPKPTQQGAKPFQLQRKPTQTTSTYLCNSSSSTYERTHKMWQWLWCEQQNLKSLKSNQSNTTKHATQKIFNYYSSQKAPKSSHHPMIETLTLNSEEFKSMWTWSKWYLISLTWTWRITVNAKKNEPEYYNPSP